MELNDTIFPEPLFNYDTLNNFPHNVLYIPIDKDEYNKANKKPLSSSKKKEINDKYEFIPCLFVQAKRGKLSNNFIIMFHGNGEDIFHSYEMADGLSQKLEMNVIVVEYPGYSMYQKDKSSQTILEDSLYIYEYIKNHFKNVHEENIFVYGRSIGSAPAIYLASQKKIAGLFLVSAFTTVKAIAKNMIGFLSFLVKERFTSINYIQNVECPIYFIHGKSDSLIPYTETVKLFENCSYKEKNGASYPPHMTHNDFSLKKDILEPIKTFIQKQNLQKPSEGSSILGELFKTPFSVYSEFKNRTGSVNSVSKIEYDDLKDK